MFTEPVAQPPHRVMIMGACRDPWYEASKTTRDTEALPVLKELVESWQRSGMTIIDSFDDDFFQVGQPSTLPYSFFILCEVPSILSLVSMLNQARTDTETGRADKYFRFEARIGRGLFILDLLEQP